VNSMGYSYHNDEKLINNVNESFEFKEGDQIQIDYDIINNALTFIKNNAL
jgi:hypothetical protein